MPNAFDPVNFDPAQVAPNDVVIFDDNGYIDLGGGYANPSVSVQDLQGYLDSWLEADFANAGFAGVVNDIDTQFADATYFYAVNSAVSTSQGTVYYDDHGIQGTAGSDVVIDGSGDNVVNTGKGADLIMLGSGANHVDAGRGDDVVVTGTGADVIKLGAGHDWLWSGAGDDLVRAGGGDDTVQGREGADTISGGAGEDVLLGGADDDRLLGGADNDRLDGGTGNDVMAGGSGADVFVFAAGSGRDVVRDFEDGLDRIEIDMASTGLSGFADLGLSQIGNRVEVDLGNGDEIVLRDMQISDLTSADFDFV